MSISKLFAQITITAGAVFAWTGSFAFAADTPGAAAPGVVVGAAPVTVGMPACESCQGGTHGVAKTSCTTCGKLLGSNLHRDKKAPYPVNLCPGACFGYFQTQWRKWDEVCPYPYLGIGPGNNSSPPAGPYFPPHTPPTGVQPSTAPNGTLPAPRPLDPKMTTPKKIGSTGELPPIPTPPGKFGP
jgi:hypothetical protein